MKNKKISLSPEIKKILYKNYGVEVIDGLNLFYSYLERKNYILSDDFLNDVIFQKKVKNKKDLEFYLRDYYLGVLEFLKYNF